MEVMDGQRLRPTTIKKSQQKTKDMELAAELRKPLLRAWLSETGETSALIGAAVSAMNPEVFSAGLKCIEKVTRNPDVVTKGQHLSEVLAMWTSPYTGFSLINNRDTPLHRDNGAGYTAMDTLLTVGEYKNGWIYLPGLGYRLFYNSGTMVMLAGRVIRHAAAADGERLCCSWYLRSNVLQALNVEEPGWVNIDDFNNL